MPSGASPPFAHLSSKLRAKSTCHPASTDVRLFLILLNKFHSINPQSSPKFFWPQSKVQYFLSEFEMLVLMNLILRLEIGQGER
jgi:hypothetical protein